MRERWTEHDRKVKVTTEKTTQTSASVLSAGTGSASSGTTGPPTSVTNGQGGNTTSWWCEARAAARAKDSNPLDFGLRSTRDSSMSYY